MSRRAAALGVVTLLVTATLSMAGVVAPPGRPHAAPHPERVAPRHVRAAAAAPVTGAVAPTLPPVGHRRDVTAHAPAPLRRTDDPLALARGVAVPPWSPGGDDRDRTGYLVLATADPSLGETARHALVAAVDAVLAAGATVDLAEVGPVRGDGFTDKTLVRVHGLGRGGPGTDRRLAVSTRCTPWCALVALGSRPVR